ncbi:MAG: ABC transporter permease [Candidatus Sulfopaludibacter sp.]|nr:ABC transporter permease [Candidatus Sulfopaludibacter sp.]
MLRALLRDLRFAVRMLAKAPGFTAIAVLCLALGIGVNTTVFSLVDGYWTRPLPVPQAQQLVYLYTATPRDPQDSVSFPEFLDYQARAKSFSGLLATERRGGILTGPGFADAVQSNVVSSSYFQVLGIAAQVGRVFTPGDAAGPRVLVMSHNLWQRRFGGDPSIVGRTIRINGLYTVIGIAPADFRGVEMWRDSDVWIPQSSWDPSGAEAAERSYRSFTVMGRLRPGVALETARTELTAISAQIELAWPKFNKGCRALLLTDSERLHRYKLPYILMGIVALVLLIACANVAGLLLARAGSRTYEMGVRVALGASRRRLVSQLMAESTLIGAMGTAAGLLLARVLIALLPAVIIPPAAGYLHFQFRLDQRVLAFTLLASLFTIFVFGLAPALRTSAVVSRGARRAYSRRILVVAQMVLSIVLLSGAGLLVRTFTYCMNLDPGFTRGNVLVAEISPPYNSTGSHAFYGKLLARAPGIPGVLDATLALRAPLSGSGGGTAQNIGIATNPPQRVKYTAVDLHYFRTLGIALLRGRDFDTHDQPGSTRVMIVNRTMAQRFWPNENALGKTARLSGDPPGTERTIVGVAADTRVNSLEEPAEPYFYLPFAQTRFSTMYLIARTSPDPVRMARQVRAEIAAIDPGVPVTEITSMNLLVRSTVFEQQVSATIVGSLGLIGLLLAAIGLYGLISYTVAERTRELGIRMALGAQRGHALRLILRQAFALSAIGIAVGLGCALFATRLLREMLYGVSTRDPLTFAAVIALMLAVALLASYLPARRATRIDPMTALRYE